VAISFSLQRLARILFWARFGGDGKIVESKGQRAAPPPGNQGNGVAAASCELIYLAIYKTRGVERAANGEDFHEHRSQAVRLPKEFQFDTREVFIRKLGDEVILTPRPADWTSYLEAGPVASAQFIEGVEDLPVQEREP
jgi:antitoxin VapB